VKQLAKCLPDLDLTLPDHFAQVLHLEDSATSIDSAQKHVERMYVAFELLEKGFMVKTYFQFCPETPPSLATVMNLIRNSLRKHVAFDELVAFMSYHPMGTALRQDALAVDCIEPAKSRLKLYAVSGHTSFDSVVSVMTLGGKIQCTEESITELADLFRLVLGLPEDFSRKAELLVSENYDANVAHKWWAGWKKVFAYHFDIGSSTSLPDVKAYLPVDTCGKSEREVAAGLKAFLESRGRGKYSDGFLSFVRMLLEDFPSDNKLRAHTWIACWFKNGELHMTSYVAPWVNRNDGSAEK
jgi:DMATS type aromatic prenyltransferase